MTRATLCHEGKRWLGRGESLWASLGCRSCGVETKSEASTMAWFVVSGYHRCHDVILPIDHNSPPAGR